MPVILFATLISVLLHATMVLEGLSMWPFILLVAPPFALLGGCFSLYQFAQIYINLSRVAQRPATNAIWKTVKPYAREVVRALTSTLGDPDKFLSKIQPTHVILCALLIVIVVSTERILHQLSKLERRR